MNKFEEDILKAQQDRVNAIQKSFESNNDIEKGIYKNNSENRKLGRVGKTFGGEKESEKKDELKVGDIYEHSGGKAKIESIEYDKQSGKKLVSYKHINEKGVHSNEQQTIEGFHKNKGKKIEEYKNIKELKPLFNHFNDKYGSDFLNKLNESELKHYEKIQSKDPGFKRFGR